MDQRLDDTVEMLGDEAVAFFKKTQEHVASLRFPTPEGNGEQALIDSVHILGKEGLLTYAVQCEKSLTRFLLCREILAYHSVIADLAFVMQALGSQPVSIAGSQEQKDAYLPGVESGEHISAFALSEPGAGSDVAALTTQATKQGDNYLLKGTKRLISNAGVATHYVVFARTAEGAKNVSAFLIPAQTTGLETRQTPTMTAHPLGQVILNDVTVHESQRIGAEGDGMKLALKTLSRGRPSVGAAACGFARRALEDAMRHVKQRKAFGGVLADQQLVQSMIAHSVTELDAARLLVYRIAQAFDKAPNKRHDRASAEAKWYATEAAQRIIDRCQQVAGGISVLDGCLLSELYRAIRPLRIYEGASEVQQVLIARSLLNDDV